MVIKTIILLCLTKNGFMLENPDNYKLNDHKVQVCVDKVSECYYTKDKDIFKCIKSIHEEN